MDPNANMAEQERILNSGIISPEGHERLKELQKALDSWLKNGGFRPKWSEYPCATKSYKLRNYIRTSAGWKPRKAAL